MARTMNRRPTHPGAILEADYLEPKEMTQSAAAEKMGMSLNRLNEIVKGKRGVTADTALRFAMLTGTTAEFWMNLQTAVDLYDARLAMTERK